MAAEGEGARTHRWYFTKEELAKSPSRADGVDPEKELRYRQDAASLIQEMGPRLSLNPLCVSTAIVYMHRFYMINSFKAFDRGIIATAALFLAAKVEELPKKLEFVAKCSYNLLHKDAPALEVPSETYNKLIDDITYHELIILQTLGFDVQVKHPHPHVVECMNLVGVSKDLSQAAFFLAHNSQLLTTFCLQYRPTVVACMCIHLTCVWKGLEIPRSNDNKNWWEYVDRSVTQNKLEELAKEFLTIVDKSPTRLKKRIQENFRMAVEGTRPHGSSSLPTSKDHSSRHPPVPGMSSSSGSSSMVTMRHKSEHSSLHSSALFNKHHHQQHGTHPHASSSSQKQPPHHGHHHPPPSHSTKPHRSPPPPPPPHPPSSHSSHTEHSSTAQQHLQSSSHKHRKHKEHPHNQQGFIQRPEKHTLVDSNVPPNKLKKFKLEDPTQLHSPHKQKISVNDYRQSKRHQQQYQQAKGLPMNKKNLKPHSDSQSSLSTLPPFPNSHSTLSVSSSSSSSRTHSNNSSLPPLPPPLPSHKPSQSPPPPPPPPS